MKKLWFKRKTYGWGWYPGTWEGWVITLLYLILVVGFAYQIDETATQADVINKFILPVLILTVVFIFIAYRTGESPRWQWGTKKKHSRI